MATANKENGQVPSGQGVPPEIRGMFGHGNNAGKTEASQVPPPPAENVTEAPTLRINTAAATPRVDGQTPIVGQVLESASRRTPVADNNNSLSLQEGRPSSIGRLVVRYGGLPEGYSDKPDATEKLAVIAAWIERERIEVNGGKYDARIIRLMRQFYHYSLSYAGKDKIRAEVKTAIDAGMSNPDTLPILTGLNDGQTNKNNTPTDVAKKARIKQEAVIARTVKDMEREETEKEVGWARVFVALGEILKDPRELEAYLDYANGDTARWIRKQSILNGRSLPKPFKDALNKMLDVRYPDLWRPEPTLEFHGFYKGISRFSDVVITNAARRAQAAADDETAWFFVQTYLARPVGNFISGLGSVLAEGTSATLGAVGKIILGGIGGGAANAVQDGWAAYNEVRGSRRRIEWGWPFGKKRTAVNANVPDESKDSF